MREMLSILGGALNAFTLSDWIAVWMIGMPTVAIAILMMEAKRHE
jgi:hypothetical protein